MSEPFHVLSFAKGRFSPARRSQSSLHLLSCRWYMGNRIWGPASSCLIWGVQCSMGLESVEKNCVAVRSEISSFKIVKHITLSANWVDQSDKDLLFISKCLVTHCQIGNLTC